jgi:hypothetical protein
MSWDIFVQDIPPSITSVKEIPDNFSPAAIGRRPEIIGRILEVVPFADFSDPAWGRIYGSDFSIEVNMGDDDPVFGFAFHVRGGDIAAEVITDILLHLGLRAFDPTAPSGIFKVGEDPVIGLRRWREFRNSVLNK